MQPEQEPHHLTQPPHRPDPTASSKSLAIALVVAAAFLLAAAGIIVWLVLGHKPNQAAAVNNTPSDDAVNVKKVSFVPPIDLPANYAKNDQSKADATTIFYYDDATNCGLTLGVSPVPATKSTKDVVTDALAAAETQGVATVTKTDADKMSLKDTASGKAYTFDGINLEQTVNVPGVAFTKQNNTILYKQFGSSVASLSYACKSETWQDKKAELYGIAQKFTVKTER